MSNVSLKSQSNNKMFPCKDVSYLLFTLCFRLLKLDDEKKNFFVEIFIHNALLFCTYYFLREIFHQRSNTRDVQIFKLQHQNSSREICF
jgi:hypothetical protein